jgi:hypothetical protein
MSTFKQWSSLRKSVGKFIAKKFYEIGPSGVDLIELFDINLPTLLYVRSFDGKSNKYCVCY